MGRHWMSIDGKIIVQNSGDDVWLRDEDVQRLVYVTVDHGEHFKKPPDIVIKEEEQKRRWETCKCCGEPEAWHRYIVDPNPRCPLIDEQRFHRGWGSSCFVAPDRDKETHE